VTIQKDAADATTIFTAQGTDANTLDVLAYSIVAIAPTTDKFVVDGTTGLGNFRID
jgi:hypothetical protein